MSNKEIVTELVERIKGGEQGLMPELWKAVERLVAWQTDKVIKRLPASAGVTFEDLYNSGYIALCAAVERYEEEKGEFISLFMLCLKTAFAEAAGYRSKRQKIDLIHSAESLDVPLSDEEDYLLRDVVPDPSAGEAFEEAERKIFLEQLRDVMEVALSTLSDERQAIIRARYYENKSIPRIAAERGVSVSKARAIEGKALHDLRKPKVKKRLKEFIEERTPYYLRVSLEQFNSTGTSAVEKIAMLRESWQEQYRGSFGD